MQSAYIYEAYRTPRGRKALFEVKPIDLLATVLTALSSRHGLDQNQVNDLIIGCVTPVGDQGANIAKAVIPYIHWPHTIPGMQINRLCASGLEAVHLAAVKIMTGYNELVIAGGVESMSRVPMESDGGAQIFDPAVLMATRYVPQGVAADLIATKEGYTRETLDEWAIFSHNKAHEAQRRGYFEPSLVPIKDQNGLLILDSDDNVRSTPDKEKMGQLPAVFEDLGMAGFDAIAQLEYPEVEYIQHRHTAANSSAIVDGAAVVLVGSEAYGKKYNKKPRAVIRSMAVVGDEPTVMLEGAAPAAKLALNRAGMNASDIDLWEMNEAFAAAVLKFRGCDGHPLRSLKRKRRSNSDGASSGSYRFHAIRDLVG